MASCKDCKHYPMCGFSKYTKTPNKCLDFLDASDVVKVVRCKNCKHYVLQACACRHENFNGIIHPNGYCYYGERKDNG